MSFRRLCFVPRSPRPIREQYEGRARKPRIVFSGARGLASLRGVEIGGDGHVPALLVRVPGLPAKWTRRVGPRRVSEILDLFHEVDFFSLEERFVPREA